MRAGANYMWLKIIAYSDLSPTGVCSRFERLITT